MASIKLTNNADLDITATTDDKNATLNKYLKDVLTFKQKLPDPKAIAAIPVKDIDTIPFPVTFTSGGDGKFAVEKSTLEVKLDATAQVGVVNTAGDMDDLFSVVAIPHDPATAGVVSLAIGGTLDASLSGSAGDFSFGIEDKASVTLTSYYSASATDAFRAALENAAKSVTIPHDISDLDSLPKGVMCQLDAASAISFQASVAVTFLNSALANATLGKLPDIALSASGSATVEATVTHSSDHLFTLFKQRDGTVLMAVGISHTDDFETSLTVSAGIKAKVGDQDALAFLLDKFSLNSKLELQKIQGEMSPADFSNLNGDIKSAIDTALSSSFAATLKAALDSKETLKNTFVFKIDLAAVEKDAGSRQAVLAALAGDLTQITAKGAAFAGITTVQTVRTVTDTVTHTIALHLLGILNAASVDQFLVQKKLKTGVTGDTAELVISDERIQVFDNNLAKSDKLRELNVKSAVLTIPLTAATKPEKLPLNIVFFDRKADTGRGAMQGFVNLCRAMSAPNAAAATALLNENLKNYGICSLAIDVNLTPDQCNLLFLGNAGIPFDQAHYLGVFSDAKQTILAGETDALPQDRLKLFSQPVDLTNGKIWRLLLEAPVQGRIQASLGTIGIKSPNADLMVADVLTAIFWSDAMAKYAQALSNGDPLENVGKDFIQDSGMGFDDPWFILSVFNMADTPPSPPIFTSTLLPAADAKTKAVGSTQGR